MSRILFNSAKKALPAPFVASSSDPIDPRIIVENFADITGSTNNCWTAIDKYCDAYLGMDIYVKSEQTTYKYVGPSEKAGILLSEAIKKENWRKISDSDTKSDLLLTNIKINGVNGTNSNHIASVTIDSNDIQLGNDYKGQEVKSGTTVVTPVSADTVSTAVKKIIDIILDDEKVISASENNLNDHINDLSGKTITEITSKDNTVTLVKGEDAANDTISVDLSVNAETTKGVLGLHYDKDKKTITISSTAGESVPTGDFIKDGMINSVALDTDKKNLVITWNTDAGLQPTTIPLKDFAQIYKFDTEGDTTHNVKFSEVQTSDGQTEIQANVTTIDCGEYEGE